MIKIKAALMSLCLSVIMLGGVVPLLIPQTASAAAPRVISSIDDCSVRFLTFPTWFRGLVELKGGKCVIVSPEQAGGLGPFIWHIVLNVIEMALQVVIYAAVVFIMYGGFLFLTSNGDATLAAKARQTILNAVIGIAISIASIAAVNLISGILIINP